ncbi:unnamed protein product, partial [Scytosiphon promiscuus]
MGNERVGVAAAGVPDQGREQPMHFVELSASEPRARVELQAGALADGGCPCAACTGLGRGRESGATESTSPGHHQQQRQQQQQHHQQQHQQQQQHRDVAIGSAHPRVTGSNPASETSAASFTYIVQWADYHPVEEHAALLARELGSHTWCPQACSAALERDCTACTSSSGGGGGGGGNSGNSGNSGSTNNHTDGSDGGRSDGESGGGDSGSGEISCRSCWELVERRNAATKGGYPSDFSLVRWAPLPPQPGPKASEGTTGSGACGGWAPPAESGPSALKQARARRLSSRAAKKGRHGSLDGGFLGGEGGGASQEPCPGEEDREASGPGHREELRCSSGVIGRDAGSGECEA